MSEYQLLGSNYKDGSYSINNQAPVSWHMGKGIIGSYDGLKLHPTGGSSWRHYPSNAPLIKGKVFVPQGTPVPLKNEEYGVDIPKDSMFMFARNIASPLCCPSTYSTSTGCVCTTPEQRRIIGATRGGNKTYCSDPDY